MENALRQIPITILMVATVCAAARADIVFLRDGRTIQGDVSLQDDQVVIQTDEETIQVPLQEVVRVRPDVTPEEEFKARLDQTPVDDADALVALATWAMHDLGLEEQARSLFGRALALEPDNQSAWNGLGYVFLDDRWFDRDAAMNEARRLYQNEEFPLLRRTTLPAIQAMLAMQFDGTRSEDWRDLLGMLAESQLRCGDFLGAAESYQKLSLRAGTARAVRYRTIARILRTHPDGMVLLRQAYPPQSMLLAENGPVLQAGPASLTDPLVLQAALWSEARPHVLRARSFVHQAVEVSAEEPLRAETILVSAERSLELAEAMCDDIAQNERIDIRRVRIGIHQCRADKLADHFDTLLASYAEHASESNELQAVDLAAELIYLVDEMERNLLHVINLCREGGTLFTDSMNKAREDLAMLEDLREVLRRELPEDFSVQIVHSGQRR